MQTIGVRELHTHTAEVLRQVREDGIEYVITAEGAPVARLVPIAREVVQTGILEETSETADTALQAYERLVQELRQNWPEGVTTQAIMDEIRGE
ncbi:MAG: type II toxin-antitoxin system prevent-host-death family antitoxin [Anaerolineae bacterium]|nr:type II toxin-antitoxin system prevent-host-death family antitoxin [Anaerolineae bacterium]